MSRHWLPWLGLAVLAALPYLGALDNPLLHDDRTLLDNAWLREQADFSSVWTHDYWFGTRHAGSDLYRPVTVTTLLWNLRSAPSRLAFHGVNLLLHVLVTLLAAAAVRQVLRASDARPGSAAPAAWIAAAVYAVHPLASEAVLLAVGRAEMLAAGLGLAAFVLWLQMERGKTPGGYRLALSLACFFLALGSKESAASWLLIGALWKLLARQPEGTNRTPGLYRAAAYVGVFVLFLVMRGAVVGGSAHAPPWVDNPLVRVDGATRIANASLVLGRFGLKMLAPWSLSVEHGFDQIPVAPLLPWGAVAAIALLVAWGAVLVLLARRSRAAAFFWAFVPAAFAVTGNVAFPIGAILAERLAYLPLLGACGLTGLGLSRIPRPAWLKIVLVAVILTAGIARTATRARDFQGLVNFHEATVRASPRSVKALFNLGRTRLEVQKQPREAIDLLGRAVSIWPDYPQALRLLAEAHARLGEDSAAADYRERAAGVETRYPDPRRTPP